MAPASDTIPNAPMPVYRVLAENSDHPHLVPASRASSNPVPGERVAENWQIPPLILYKGRKKGADPDFWSYDAGVAFVISHQVATALADEDWCQIIPLEADVHDPKGKPAGHISKYLLFVTRTVDAVNHEATTYKPYGNQVLDWDRPGATRFQADLLPTEGLFLQPSGNSCETLCSQGFVDFVESRGWTGLRFIPVA